MAEQTKHEFTIFVNNQPFKTSAHELSGAEIKALAGVPADYELFEVNGTQTSPVSDGQKVHIHNDQHFRAIPSGTFGQRDVTT
jgi:hypothetical protein